MPLFSCPNRRLLFVHIPKTGGTSIEDFFRGRRCRVGLFARRQHPCLKVTPQHLTSDEIHYLIGDDFDYEFTVVRNPFDRVESEFFYDNKQRARGKLPAIPEEMFSAWLAESIATARNRPYFRDGHFRPQHEFVRQGTRIFFFEDGLEAVVETACKEAGLRMEGRLPESNKSERRPLTWTKEVTDLFRAFYAGDFERFGYSNRR